MIRISLLFTLLLFACREPGSAGAPRAPTPVVAEAAERPTQAAPATPATPQPPDAKGEPGAGVEESDPFPTMAPSPRSEGREDRSNSATGSSTPEDHPGEHTTTEQAPKQTSRTLRFEAQAMCTRKGCPRPDPCCNTCRFLAWASPTDARLRLVADAVPRPEVDGCGQAAYQLRVRGRRVGKTFVANKVQRVPVPPPE